MDFDKSGDKILADRGFRIEEIVGLKGASIVASAFTKGKSQLPGQDVSESRILSKARVCVERCITHIKCYRILKTTWPLSYLEDINDGRSFGVHVLMAL